MFVGMFILIVGLFLVEYGFTLKVSDFYLFVVILALILSSAFSLVIGIEMGKKQIQNQVGIEKVESHSIQVDGNSVSNWVEVVWKDGRKDVK